MSDFKISIFPIMGNIVVERQTERGTRCQNEDLPKDNGAFKRNVTMAKKKGKQMLKATAKSTPEDTQCFYWMRRNRAVQSHLIYFCGIVHHACVEEWAIAYGEYRMRMKPDQLNAFHKILTRWSRDNLKDTHTAISLGVGAVGYVHLYFVTTAENKMMVHDTALKIAQYLRKKKFAPIVLRPYELDPLAFLRWKYQNDHMENIDMLLCGDLWAECWEVMRASFSLPYCHRTIRTNGATEIIESQAHHADFYDGMAGHEYAEQSRYMPNTSALVDYGEWIEDKEEE